MGTSMQTQMDTRISLGLMRSRGLGIPVLGLGSRDQG